MKIYRYWTIESAVWLWEGVEQQFTTYGRSNLSVEDSRRDGQERLEKVRRKLAGEDVPRKQEYSVDIREEIVEERDSQNAITRNRYGALVWNTMEYTILDIDAHRPTFWERFGFKKRDPKQAILEDLEKMVQKPAYRDLGFRIYETVQGYRIVVLGRYFEPRTPAFDRLVYNTHTDWLYAAICQSQNCYRARLTPKPHRVGIKGIRYKWPMDAHTYQEAQAWVQGYDAASVAYATCRYVTTLGSAVASPNLGFHDHPTGALTGKPLA